MTATVIAFKPGGSRVQAFDSAGAPLADPSTYNVMTHILGAESASVTPAAAPEEVVATLSLPASTLERNGQILRGKFYFVHAANTTSATASIRLGGLAGTVLLTRANAVSGDVMVLEFDLLRLTATTQACFGKTIATDKVLPSVSTPSKDLGTALDLVVTLTNAGALTDLAYKGGVVELIG